MHSQKQNKTHEREYLASRAAKLAREPEKASAKQIVPSAGLTNAGSLRSQNIEYSSTKSCKVKQDDCSKSCKKKKDAPNPARQSRITV